MERVIAFLLIMLICVPFLDSNFYFDQGASDAQASLNLVHRAAQDVNVSHDKFVILVQNIIRKTSKAIHLSICKEGTGCMRYNTEVGGPPILAFEQGIHSVWPNDLVMKIAAATEYYSSEYQTFFKSDPDTGYIPSEQLTIYATTERIDAEFRADEITVTSIIGCYGPERFPREKGFNGQGCASALYVDSKYEAQASAALNIARTIFITLVLIFSNLKHKADADRIVIRPIERMVASIRQLTENPMGTIRRQDKIETRELNDETDLLEQTINRVGQLLQIGFGEAGSRIIAKNMKSSHSINPLVNGVKMNAVFGFCDIRNFTDTTECLQERVMVYVNKVGQIVHEATHQFSGAANKNIGDAFLLVWRIEDKAGEENFGIMCDKALMAFLKIMVDLKRENAPGGILHGYKSNKLIKKRFGNNFNIRLGMGLHVGWAIEGAIGSKYKIDASYLSPNVNMAARLEAATKQFKTDLLLSEDFYDYLSARARNRCRLIDKVTVKGSIKPMGIYTFDITDYPHHFAEFSYDEHGNRYQIGFESKEFEDLQKSLDPEFCRIFKKGVDLYLQGHWMLAKELLEEALTFKENDGATTSLLEILKRKNYTAPDDWSGHRELTEK